MTPGRLETAADMVGPTSSRIVVDEDDYARLRRFLIAIQPLVGTRVYCTIGDLDWWRFTDEDPDAIRAVRLWLDAGGDVVGFAWPSDDQVDLVVHPDHRAVEAEMLAWAEVQRRAAREEPPTLTAWAFASDQPRLRLLRDRGYERGDKSFYLRRRDLEGEIEAPRLPPGYALSHVRGDEDVERRVAVHRDAFAPSRMTVAKHRAVMRAPTYRPELDLVVVAPDDSFAAFCIVWFDEANRIGVFEPVGTHSAHRRRGLGAAILSEGMRRLRQLGAKTAYVTSVGDAEAANRLYDAAGLRVVDRNLSWQKRL